MIWGRCCTLQLLRGVFQLAFSHLPLQSADVKFVLLTRGHGHIQEIIKILNFEGYKPCLIDEGSE